MMDLSTREKLLFAQAVHKIGAGPTEDSRDGPVETGRSTRKADAEAAQERDANWRKVADILQAHPCSEGSSDGWTIERCQRVYNELMTEAALVPDDPSVIYAPNAAIHLRLAQFFYKARMEQVRSEIEKQEETFRILTSEIDAIKSGQAVYNSAIISEIRTAIIHDRQRQAVERLKEASDASVAARAAKGEEAQIVTIDLDLSVPEDWAPKEDELKDAAAGVIRSMAPKRNPSPALTPNIEAGAPDGGVQGVSSGKDDNEDEAEVENLAVGSSPAVEMAPTAPTSPVAKLESRIADGPEAVDDGTRKPAEELSEAPAVRIEQPDSPTADVADKKPEAEDGDASSTRSELTPPPASPHRGRVDGSPIPPPISPAVPIKSFAQAQDGGLKPPAAERKKRGFEVPAEEEALSSPPQAPAEEPQPAVEDDEETAPAESSPVDEGREHAATEDEEDVKPVRRANKRRVSTRHVPAEDAEEEPTPSTSRRGSKQTPERALKGRGKEETAEPVRPVRGGRRSARGKEKEDTPADDDMEAVGDKPEEPTPGLRTRASRNRQAMDESDEEEDARPRKQAKVDTKPTRTTRGKAAPALAEETRRDTQPRGRASGTVDEADGEAVEVKKEEDRSPSRATHSPAVTARATRAAASTSGPGANRNFKRVILQLFEEIRSHKNAPIFAQPIKESDAPGYHDVVKKPMDLKKIKASINSGKIATIDDFQRDLYLMFCNAMMFNRAGSQPHAMAKEMMAWCEHKIVEHRNAEHHVR